MGYMRHDAIVVTASMREHITIAHTKALLIGLPISYIVDSPINSYLSFLIAPDGSKEGWAESDQGDEQRGEFIKWLKEVKRTNWSLEWVHISYGGDEPEKSRIITNNLSDYE